MVRPQLSDEQKRKQIAVRLSPRDRERITKQAEANGNSLGAEVEQLALDQLAYVEAVPEETRELLGRIASKLDFIERETKGRWFKNLAAWAAASEMLSNILDDERPERPINDDVVREALDAIREADLQRITLVAELSTMGFAVKSDPNPQGLLGARRHGLFGSMGSGSSRRWERAALDAMPPGNLRDRVAVKFDQLCKTDQEFDDARARWAEAMQPYWEAEELGRQIARQLLPVKSAVERANELVQRGRR